MKYFSYIPAGLIVLLLFALGCRKDTLGPSLVEMHGPVTVTEPFAASKNTVDFSKNEQVHFTAKFENDAAWIVTVKGQISGAVKTFEGASKSVDISNSVWTGYANTIPSFQIEPVTATLSFKYNDDTFQTTLNLAQTRNLDKLENGVVLISNFNVINPLWPKDWPLLSNTNSSYPKVDGGAYMYINEKPWKHHNFDNTQPIEPYVDFIDISAANASVNHGAYYPLLGDSNKVFFNIMVHGNGSSDTWFLINFSEENTVARHINIRPDWTGWKLLTFSYAELLDDVTLPNQPQKVTKVSFVLLSDQVPPYTHKVEIAFDHPTFTLNHPYQP